MTADHVLQWPESPAMPVTAFVLQEKVFGWRNDRRRLSFEVLNGVEHLAPVAVLVRVQAAALLD